MSNSLKRRDVLRAGGLLLAGVATGNSALALSDVHEIDMRSDVTGGSVWFDPIGLLVPLNATIRWTIRENVHTVTSYHPDNDDHSLRMPETAPPWDSDFLVNPGDSFETVLRVPGVYDYYCQPHEAGGMVGRIIVQDATGPGMLPFDYFKSFDPAPDWQEVPELARENFPLVEQILSDGIVWAGDN